MFTLMYLRVSTKEDCSQIQIGRLQKKMSDHSMVVMAAGGRVVIFYVLCTAEFPLIQVTHC